MERRFILRNLWGSSLVRTLFLFCALAATLAAQDSSSDTGNTTEHITAMSQFFDHDFVNIFGFANGVWDSKIPDGLNSTGGELYRNGLGWEAGGGFAATRTFKDGSFTISYRGAYHDYQSAFVGTGQDQTLSLAYNKRLNRHWTFNANASAGILGYGNSFYSASSVTSTTPGNPAGVESRFANVGLSLTYNQTRRLSYVFTGNFLYSGYLTPSSVRSNPLADPVSTRGVTGGLSVLYRITARTTIGGTFSHTYYEYSANSGSAQVESGSATYSHQFQDHWQLDLSAGVNHSDASGRALTPVEFSFGGVPILGYCYCPYSRTVNSPAFQGTLTHFFRHYSFSVTGGQTISGGNGLYLTSRDQFANGSMSYSTRRSNYSVGVNYSRLSSVAIAALGSTYTYYGASAAYGVNLVRYVSANARWDLIHYSGETGSFGNITEQRISFGLSISSKSVPLTLF